MSAAPEPRRGGGGAGFAQGLGAGIATSAVLVHVWLAVELSHMQEMYRDLAPDQLPVLTRLTITGVWRWGVPTVGLLAVVALCVTRPRILWPYAVAAAVLVATCLGTWYFSQAPIFELAGKIQ